MTCISASRDQAPAANGAPVDTDAVQQAYSDLYQCLEGYNDTDALELLKHLMNALTGDGAMDEPMPFSGRPGGAMDAQIRRGRAQASSYMFNKRFPDAARLRSV